MIKKGNAFLWAVGLTGMLSFVGCNATALQDEENNNQGSTPNVSVKTSAECMELAKRVLHTSEDNGQGLKEKFLKDCVTFSFSGDSSSTGTDGDSASSSNDSDVTVDPDITCDWIEDHIQATGDSSEGEGDIHFMIEPAWCEDEDDVEVPEPDICSEINIELDSNKAYIQAIFYDDCWIDELPFPLPPVDPYFPIDCEDDPEIMDCGWLPDTSIVEPNPIDCKDDPEIMDCGWSPEDSLSVNEPDPFTLEGAEKYTGYVPDNYDGAVCMALLPDCMTKSEWIKYLKLEILKDSNDVVVDSSFVNP